MVRKSGLLIAPLLFVSLFIASSLGIVRENVVVESVGTILYHTKLMGVDHFWWGEINAGHFDLLKNCGANAWREHIWYSSWRDDTPYWKDPSLTFRIQMRNFVRWANERGIKFIIDTAGYDGTPPSWRQFKADVIMNKDGMGDQWINGFGEIVRELQPYAIDVMNEPMWVYGTTYEATMTQEEFFEAYRQFCIKAIRAWRQIKPDLVCIVGGCPFWDLKPLAANPIPEPNLIYAVHYYYAFDGVTQPPEYSKAGRAYWEGRFDEAKALLESFLLYDEGIKACEDAGLQLLMEETGTFSGRGVVPYDSNFVFMQDMYDICKAHNIGVLHHSLNPFPRASTGLLNEDWTTLNDLGKLWHQNMQV